MIEIEVLIEFLFIDIIVVHDLEEFFKELLDTRRDSRKARLQMNKQPISRENWRFI
jgi:hypothetical protein